jgi:hypothetical protein
MPGFDGTGPFGEGSMTGGGRGRCAVKVGEADFVVGGRGFGRGMGRQGLGRGRGNCFRRLRGSGQSPSSSLAELQTRFDQLQVDLAALQKKTQ